MKKSVLKQELCQALIKASLYEQSCKVLVSELAEVSEALDRRRQLYKSMEELVNRKQPKSMEEMAEDLWKIFFMSKGANPLKYQQQSTKDNVMDALLKIIG
jgi:NTP pyrophosphatase (non-canonical NTP hydrolase)